MGRGVKISIEKFHSEITLPEVKISIPTLVEVSDRVVCYVPEIIFQEIEF